MSGWSIHIPMRMYNKCENASIAQWLVQLTCNEQVVGSNPTGGSNKFLKYFWIFKILYYIIYVIQLIFEILINKIFEGYGECLGKLTN